MLPTMLRSRRRSGGFSLMELLTVTAIIAILAAVLLPVLSRARAKGYQTTCTSNLRQIYAALRMYEQDFDGWYPPWHNYKNSTTATQASYRPDLLHSGINLYLKNQDVWFCRSSAYRGQSVVWSGVDQRYTTYRMPRVLWHYKLMRVTGRPTLPPDQVPLMGDPQGAAEDADTPGLTYTGLPHFEGSVILWADGHVKWTPGKFDWQVSYP